eukprot:9259011-Pyramimonas_sp.AAC.1
MREREREREREKERETNQSTNASAHEGARLKITMQGVVRAKKCSYDARALPSMTSGEPNARELPRSWLSILAVSRGAYVCIENPVGSMLFHMT